MRHYSDNFFVLDVADADRGDTGDGSCTDSAQLVEEKVFTTGPAASLTL